MAAIDLATIRGRVRFLGDYQNVQKFPNADVDKEIQTAFGAFYELVDDAHEGWWDVATTGVTVSNQEYVALPADAWRVRGIDILDGGDYRELAQVGISDRNRFGSATDMPDAYRLAARGAELYPTPNTAYTLRFTYAPKAPTLQEAQPREWYNGWEEYVIEATLLALDKREKRPLNDRLTALDIIAKRVKSGVAQRRSQEPEYIPLREGGTAGLMLADLGIFE